MKFPKLPKRLQRLSFLSLVVIFSFAWGAVTVRERVFPYGLAENLYRRIANPEDSERLYESDRLWAGKIAEGGYILHFRHAQREKWNDVTAFDAYEVLSGLDAETSSFSQATCLTTQGIEEAKLIGNVFKLNKVKIGGVISSPSCRAVQTARYAFGRIDRIDISLLHRTAMMREQWNSFALQLRELFLEHPPSPGENIIFSGHGGTLGYDAEVIFHADETGGIDDRDETGFVVIEIANGKIYARHRFVSIKSYVNASLLLPVDSD